MTRKVSAGLCGHLRHQPVLLGLREPWKSDWEGKALSDESRLLPPLFGGGLFEFETHCADCGARLNGEVSR